MYAKFNYSDIMIFTGNANRKLAADIAAHLGKPLGNSSVTTFADGEICMRINETVRGRDIFIIQPTSPPVNNHLMELLIMIDALKRSSAGRITAVIPYFGYARQDRKARSHDPISAKLVANMITTAGADRVLSMDLHCPQLQGFFDLPMDHMRGIYQFSDYLHARFKDLSDFMVVSPDLGGVSDCRNFAEMLKVPLGIIDKRRPKDNVSEVMHFIGDVEGKTVVLLDEVVTTAGTLCNAANVAKAKGAKTVYACVTHAVLCCDAVEKIKKSGLDELIVLNTIDVPEERRFEKITVLDASETFAAAIRCIHTGESIGSLFYNKNGNGSPK